MPGGRALEPGGGSRRENPLPIASRIPVHRVRRSRRGGARAVPQA
jgi:hypothetical protein